MSKPNIWIFSLEPLDSRYTKQWHTNIPEILTAAAGDRFNVRQIDGVQRVASVTSGAFLNFSDTNYWKSTQLCNFVELLDAGETTVNDKFLFTDAWNPCITQIAYMRDLLEQKWELHGIWHAGAYDPSDILGYKMQKPWPWHAEKSWFYSCDYNYYASNFHKDMFLKNLDIDMANLKRAVRSGQPHGEIIKAMELYANAEKSNDDLVMWPHRFNADKQPDIAVDLRKDFDMVITQQLSLTKDEYYATLAKSKIMFSCALHENLGISVMEGVLAGVIPVLPDRCSYKEMYLPEFKYPSEWTENFEKFQFHRTELTAFIQERIDNRDKYLPLLEEQKAILMKDYLQAGVMVEKIIGLDSAI
jgi:hypothetical protein